jgi:hypothetical protein
MTVTFWSTGSIVPLPQTGHLTGCNIVIPLDYCFAGALSKRQSVPLSPICLKGLCMADEFAVPISALEKIYIVCRYGQKRGTKEIESRSTIPGFSLI